MNVSWKLLNALRQPYAQIPLDLIHVPVREDLKEMVPYAEVRFTYLC